MSMLKCVIIICLMSQSFAQEGFDMQGVHERLSVSCFNDCWGLIEKADRTKEETEDMILLASASLWHWKQRSDCQAVNLSVAYWQMSRVHVLAGDGVASLAYGQKCLLISNKGALDPFYVGYAHEAIARAASLAGDGKMANEHLGLARVLAE